MSGRVSAGRQFVVAAVAAYSGYPPNHAATGELEGHEYCCEHAGGVSRNGACVDPVTLSVEGGGGSTVQPTRHPVAPVIAPRRPR
jgi:hypothetical protein